MCIITTTRTNVAKYNNNRQYIRTYNACLDDFLAPSANANIVLSCMSAIEFPNVPFLPFLSSFDKVLERRRSWYCLFFSGGILPRHGRMSYPESFAKWMSALVAFMDRNGFGWEPLCSRGHHPQVHPEKGFPLSSNPVILLILGHSQILESKGRSAF